MTLAFEDAKSKLLDVVSAADDDAKERVDDSMVEILKFGKIKAEVCLSFLAKFLFRLKVWSRL